MTPAEVAGRVRDAGARRAWKTNTPLGPARPDGGRDGDTVTKIDPAVLAAVPDATVKDLLACADDLMAGTWPFFDRVRHDLAPDADWFLCAVTGKTAPSTGYAFDINHRHEDEVGNIKYVWELSRHQHLTVLAAAYALTGDDRYAERVDLQLRSWIRQNPFLQGIQWTSAIEVGVRLISWVWLRRLLDGWHGTPALFEENSAFVGQVWEHQAYCEKFESHGTSANNHLLAELAGLFAASCAFPWFEESDKWRAHSAALLRREVPLQTFPSGVNRELASEYHGFVLELVLAAALEGEATNNSLGPVVWQATSDMFDALAASVDTVGYPARQGDQDEGHGLLLASPHYDRWASLLATGEALVGNPGWWFHTESFDLRSHLWGHMANPESLGLSTHRRPAARPNQFRDAGLTFLRDLTPTEDELWCRIDHGPHGFLATAGHAHADALSVEIRHGGVDILADPGTYCYHGEPEWRAYFRSTVGHNTLELLGRDQSKAEGPFLWSTHANGIIDASRGLNDGPLASVTARHDGYAKDGLMHKRTVELDRDARRFLITDVAEGADNTECRLGFHFGPTVDVELDGDVAHLEWIVGTTTKVATLALPPSLSWTTHRGETNPPFGWYSRVFGAKEPAVALIGSGVTSESQPLISSLSFGIADTSPTTPSRGSSGGTQ